MPVEEEWEYRLPSPPSAFRDSRSHSPTVTEFDTVTLAEANLSTITSVPGLEKKTDMLSLAEPSEKELLSECIENTIAVSKTSVETQLLFKKHSEEEKVMTADVIRKSESSRKDELEEQNSPSLSKKSSASETVIKAARPVINSTIVPNDTEKSKLQGSAAVLQELNKVLSEQRITNSTSHRPVLQNSESSLHPSSESAPIENFSMAVYSRPTSTEGMPPPEVRPSLVLARRSSFSNSNGNLNTIPRSQGTGVRRTTSHATLFGNRRDSGDSNDNNQSIENQGKSYDKRSYYASESRQDTQSLGRAVSAMNLNSGVYLYFIKNMQLIS